MECCQRDSGGASAGSVTGGRGQGTGESLTVTEVLLSPQPLSADGNEVAGSQAT